MKELYRMPGHLIRRAQQVSNALFTEECEQFNLTSVQFAALFAIRNTPGLDATRLANLIAFDRSTIGDVLERLEAKNWILRENSPHDKRIKQLYLAPEGEKLLLEVEPAVNRVQERLLAPLALSDRATIIKLLADLVKLHDESSPP